MTTTTKPERIRIDTTAPLEVTCEQLMEALTHSPKLYRYAGEICEIVQPDPLSGQPTSISRVGPNRLRLHAAKVAKWTKPVKTRDGDVEQEVEPPMSVVKAVHETPDFQADYNRLPRGLRPLRGLLSGPTVLVSGPKAGQPVTDEGYDRDLAMYLDESPIELDLMLRRKAADIERNPLRTARGCVKALLSIVEEVPWESEHAKSAWLALVLTLVCKPAIRGNAPLFLITANTAGSGKSNLFWAASIIAHGKRPGALPTPANEEEWGKTLLSIGLAGSTTAFFDNVRNGGTFGSASLDMAITCNGQYSGRVLGASNYTTVPLNATFAASGNNISITGDLGRRTVPIRLDPRMERPQDHQYRNPPPPVMAKAQRVRLLAAAIVLMQCFAQLDEKERPKLVRASRMQSFDEWSVIPAALRWAGMPDPLGDVGVMLERSDPESGYWADLLRALRGWKHDDRFRSKDLLILWNGRAHGPGAGKPREQVAVTEAMDMAGFDSGRAKMSTRSITKALAGIEGAVHGGLRLEPAKRLENSKAWKVVEVG